LDLQRLRLRLSGLQPERLIVAGVHHEGDQALVAAAERVAAMRDQAPVWRGDDDFRATSWVDASATDRGLAVHGGAFVIAPRQAMSELLGRSATEDSVQAVSRLRDRVLTLITIEDAARYLPQLDTCELQALRISVADSGGSPRLTLAAHYKTASLANDAPACLQKLDRELAQLPTLLAWLARAQVSEGGASAQLSMGVNSNDIEKLFNELAWALRSARRA
jgi:murein L,D-transpeptidase YcbB/YkuD